MKNWCILGVIGLLVLTSFTSEAIARPGGQVEVEAGATYTIGTPLTCPEGTDLCIFAFPGATINNNGGINAYYSGIYGEEEITINNNAPLLSDQAGPILETAINVWQDSNIVNNSTITSEFGHAIIVGEGSTVTNNGTISAYYDGIYSQGDGYIEVTNNGEIISDQYEGKGPPITSIDVGDFSTVTNNGTITSVNGSGIRVGNNSAVFNYGTVDAKQTGISGYNDVTVVNTGDITADQDQFFRLFRTGISLWDNADVTNDGTINSLYGYGISVGGNSTVVNNGTIEAAYSGIEAGDYANITNSTTGEIISDKIPGGGDDNTGISVGDYSQITNQGSILSKFGTGIAAGYNSSVLNDGSITVENAPQFGVIFYGGGGNDSLTNNGMITVNYSGGHGIAMSSGNDSLTNNASGHILIEAAEDSAFAMGQGDDELINKGTIEIDYSGYGLYMGGGNDVLDNYGTIRVDYTSDWNGVHMGEGNDELYNRQGGSIIIGYAEYGGLGFDYSDDGTYDDLLNNAGTITIEHAAANGIGMGPGNNTFINTGTIDINLAENRGIKFGDNAEGDHNNTFTNHGTINITAYNNGIEFASGDDILTTSGPLNFVVGGYAIDGGDGDDTINLTGDSNLTLAGYIANFEFLNKTGSGSWTLNGPVEAYYNTVVAEGTLEVNNVFFTNELFISDGATLTGDATFLIGPSTAYHDGIIAPGSDGIGTIEINGGDYYQSSTAELQIEVGDGSSDLLAINGGDAYLEEAGLATLRVTPAGYVADGDDFTFMTANTIYNGATIMTLIDESLVLDFELYKVSGEGDELHLGATRIPYSDVGAGGSSSFLDALIELADGGGDTGDDANDALGLIDSCSTVACINRTIGSLSPEQYPNLLDISMGGFGIYQNAVTGRMGNLHLTHAPQETNKYATSTIYEEGPAQARIPAFENQAQGWSSWGRILGMTGEQDSDNGKPGYDFDTYGVSFGFDNKVNDTCAVGVGFGLANSDVSFNGGQDTDMDSYHIGLYGTSSNERYYVDAALLFAFNDYDSTRVSTLSNARSSTDGSEWGLYVGGGLKMMETDTMYFMPTASLEYANVDIDGFTETGTGLLYDVADYDAGSLVATAGFRWGGKMVSGETRFEPELRLALAHEFGDTDRDVTASFVGTSTTFSISGVEPDETSILLGLGANFFVKDNMTLYADYDGEFRDGFDGHALSAGFRYNF